jgi:N5-(carboxyethyl)ornithine synthase
MQNFLSNKPTTKGFWNFIQMNRIGFPNTRMYEEYRVALLPDDIAKITNPGQLYFQKGYGHKYGIPDDDYREKGANIATKTIAYGLEVLCQPKFSEHDVQNIKRNQIVFGWLHLSDDSMTKKLSRKGVTAIAWEHMYKKGDHVFARNNSLTGRIGILHSIAYAGKLPEECTAAIIGIGYVGTGAKNQLETLGVKEIDVYHTRNIGLLKNTMHKYDIIVHFSSAKEIILTLDDLSTMKRGALLVDLGSNAVESMFPRSVFKPVTTLNNDANLVYCVNHIPTLTYQTATNFISQDVAPFIQQLIEGKMDKTLKDAVVIDKGKIIKDKLE